MIKVLSVRQTCMACPAQWEGELDNGWAIYARARHGGLTVEIGPTLDEAIFGEMVFAGDDDTGGWLSYAGLKEMTRDCVEWPERMENEDEYA